jgi:glycosyltransferase involved in cell wall biosynthesis
MSRQPIVSIIITFYQHRNFVERTVQSALNQEFDNFEVVAVDDGSTDGTLEFLKNIQDPRFRLIAQANCGPSLAANVGIQAANGDYIALLGGDDVAHPNRIKQQHKLVSNGYSDIAFDIPQLINDDDIPIDDAFYPIFSSIGSAKKNRVSLDHLFFHGNFLCAPSVFMRKSTYLSVGSFNAGLVQLQDFEYWVRCIKLGYRLDVFQDRLTYYRRRTDGFNLSNEKYMARVLIEENYIMRRFFDGMDVTLLKKFFKNYIPAHLSDIPGDDVLAKVLLYFYHSKRSTFDIAFDLLIDLLNSNLWDSKRAVSVGLTIPVVFDEMLRI